MQISNAIVDFNKWNATKSGFYNIRNYQLVLARFESFLGDNVSKLKDLDILHIVEFQAHLKNEKKLKDNTTAFHLVAIRQFVNFCYLRGLTKLSPELIQIPKYRNESWKPFEAEHLEKMLEAVSNAHYEYTRIRDRVVILFLYSSGVRNSELCKLKIQDLDLNVKMALIDNRKNTKKRMIFWDDRTNQAIKKLIEFRVENDIDNTFLVSTSTGKKVTARCIQHLVKRNREYAGLNQQLVPHSFRHGFAHRGVKKNINLRKLQGMMGHQSLNSTQVYMPLADPTFRSEYDKIYEEKPNATENPAQEVLWLSNGSWITSQN